MAKLLLIVAVLALVVCASARVSNSVGSNSWKSSSFDGSKLHLFEELGPITQITTLPTLPPPDFGSNSYSSCVYDPDADLATFILLEFSSPSDDGDYSLREQIRIQRGGCHSGQPVYIGDYYRRITLLERRAQPNSLAFQSLLYQSTATAFDATGLGILQRECGSAAFRIYRPVLTTECYATKLCKSRTSWGLIAWTDENTFVLGSAESCSIGDIPSDLNYAAPFRKAVLTSDVPVIATTDSSATAVFPCIILLAAMIMALF